MWSKKRWRRWRSRRDKRRAYHIKQVDQAMRQVVEQYGRMVLANLFTPSIFEQEVRRCSVS